ncbi:methionyl-tRNA formyltransferase [Flavobacterium sp. ASW18X]|uniref:methionyl-tRNA formyltransferase n=1 Tax=Flavobacterium sp. ASW18X TaxID=2572595 RepID=UPI0010AEA8A6|nr:methionyl-tRNA formyltransferase [Flavobacterium sp. ASW18X]TKD66257.1 methionyl-tRNA formyltransferase [Flavobacterium sp. ASW18X]
MSKKRNLRIVFMGTPDFAVAGLDILVKNHYNVVGVITAPDKPAGRGRKISMSAVKTYALENNIKVLQPTNLKSETFLKELQQLKVNLQVVVAFRMLPKQVWQLPEYGTFNLHASILPQYRGAAPINWAVINGEKESGVTTFFIDEKIDTGAIIAAKKTTIGDTETAGELHDRLMHLGADLILNTVQAIENNAVNTTIQDENKTLKAAPKIFRETCQINWNAPINTIYNLIRGLSPYPASWSYLRNGDEQITVKIYKADKILETHHLENGSVISTKKGIQIAVEGGYILPTEMQLPGKRKMAIKDILNGFTFHADVQFL